MGKFLDPHQCKRQGSKVNRLWWSLISVAGESSADRIPAQRRRTPPVTSHHGGWPGQPAAVRPAGQQHCGGQRAEATGEPQPRITGIGLWNEFVTVPYAFGNWLKQWVNPVTGASCLIQKSNTEYNSLKSSKCWIMWADELFLRDLFMISIGLQKLEILIIHVGTKRNLPVTYLLLEVQLGRILSKLLRAFAHQQRAICQVHTYPHWSQRHPLQVWLSNPFTKFEEIGSCWILE